MFSAIRQAFRGNREIIAERDLYKQLAEEAGVEAAECRKKLDERTDFFVARETEINTRAEKAEAEVLRLQEKLEKRTDFFVAREHAIFDRFLTSQVKTYAITDEVRHKEETIKYDQESKDAALSAFLEDKREFLEQCAREADIEDYKSAAALTYKENYNQYVMEFEQRA